MFYLDPQSAFSCDLIHVLAIYISYLVLAPGAFSPIQFPALRNIYFIKVVEQGSHPGTHRP